MTTVTVTRPSNNYSAVEIADDHFGVRLSGTELPGPDPIKIALNPSSDTPLYLYASTDLLRRFAHDLLDLAAEYDCECRA